MPKPKQIACRGSQLVKTPSARYAWLAGSAALMR